MRGRAGLFSRSSGPRLEPSAGQSAAAFNRTTQYLPLNWNHTLYIIYLLYLLLKLGTFHFSDCKSQ